MFIFTTQQQAEIIVSFVFFMMREIVKQQCGWWAIRQCHYSNGNLEEIAGLEVHRENERERERANGYCDGVLQRLLVSGGTVESSELLRDGYRLLTAVAVVAYSRRVICRLLDRAMKVPPPTAGPLHVVAGRRCSSAYRTVRHTSHYMSEADHCRWNRYTAPPRMPLERRDIAYSHASCRYTAIC